MLINSRPRKCLNYVTPFEKFLHEIKFEKMLHLILQFRRTKNIQEFGTTFLIPILKKMT